jgi:hypothetical protein
VGQQYGDLAGTSVEQSHALSLAHLRSQKNCIFALSQTTKTAGWGSHRPWLGERAKSLARDRPVNFIAVLADLD